MLKRDEYLSLVSQEMAICKHLYTKIPDGGLDYRPTKEQRSTLELMQYLSYCGVGAVVSMVENNWDKFKEYSEPGKSMSADEFPDAVDRQEAGIKEALQSLSESEILERETTYVTGQTVSLGFGLMKAYAWMVAYRMQFFLYVKQAGNPKLNTLNAWIGVDELPKN